jgi:hypothetical protein
VIPLFKTHASIGKSILKNSDILSFQKDRELKQVVMVEDTFYGFREINEKLIEAKSQLIFGIRLPVVENETDELSSKLIFFAKNNDGAKQIKNLYTKTYCSDSGLLVLNKLKEDEFNQTKVAVPFYDSFIYQNIFNFGVCDVNLKRFDHFFFEEKNDHPFDNLISEQLKRFTDSPVLSKSIYYKNRDDIDAFQFYKATCNRSGGRSPNFGNPNLEHFCSSEFCWESYLENK